MQHQTKAIQGAKDWSHAHGWRYAQDVMRAHSRGGSGMERPQKLPGSIRA